MKLRDIRDLTQFLNFLSHREFAPRLEQPGDGTLLVTFICGEMLMEVEFFEDHIEYSFFPRDRSMAFDFPWLLGQIHWNTERIVAADRRLKLRGIRDLFPFLRMLTAKRQFFRVEASPDNTITVSVDMPGKRILVEILETRVEYSYFTGDEAVDDDQDWLFGMIAGTATGLPFRPEESQ